MKKKMYDFSSPNPLLQERAKSIGSCFKAREGWVDCMDAGGRATHGAVAERRNRIILFHIILFLYTEIR